MSGETHMCGVTRASSIKYVSSVTHKICSKDIPDELVDRRTDPLGSLGFVAGVFSSPPPGLQLLRPK